MTTTELIKILKDNECGGISHKPRELSLTINGKYMPNPQITLSSTGDGICGAEIDLDVDGEFYEDQEPKTEWIDGLIVKVLLEVDGGTGDRYIRYGDICDRVEKSIREYCGAKMVESQESEDK